MSSFTNIGLVEFAKRTVAEGNWVYLMGSIGNYLTPDFLTQKVKMNQHNWYTNDKVDAIEATMATGKQYRCVDCVGLIKCYYWNDYRQGNASGYKASTDVGADYMYRIATEKGNIDTIPEILGLAVWMPGHIGVYIGNGKVIESTPNKKYAKYEHNLGGPCETDLAGRGWTHWLKVPFIDYIEEIPTNREITWGNPLDMDNLKEQYPGEWVLTSDGVRWSYRFHNGDYPANCWYKVGNLWYHFDAEGYMQTGWLLDNGKYYYLDPTPGDNHGMMRTGLIEVDNVVYYLKADGSMAANEDIHFFADENGRITSVS